MSKSLSVSQRTDKLRIFKRGDVHAVYGKRDCHIIADAFFRTRKVISKLEGEKLQGDKGLAVIYLKERLFETVVRDYAIRRKCNVEIYHRNDDTGEWNIVDVKNGSNLSAGSMGEAAFNLCSIIMSFTNKTKKIGIALYNHSISAFEIAEFIEDTQYTKLSSMFVAKGVQRCIFHCQSANQHLPEIQRFEKSVMRHGVQMVDTESDGNKFWNFIKNEDSTMRSIQNIINKQSSKRLQSFTDHSLALAALNGIILHEEMQKDDQNFYRFTLKEHKIDSFMRLDSSALAALNLFPMGQDALSKNNSNHSLYGVLNRCNSPMGRRLLSTWIRQPLVDIDQLQRRQKLVKLFVENTEQREILREEHFKKSLCDFEAIVQRLLKNKSSLKDLVDLYNFVERLRWIRETMHNLHDVEYTDYVDQDEDEDDDIKIERQSPLELLKAEFINPICGLMNDFVGFMGMIEKVVDLAAVEEHRYCINLTFDKMLEKLHRKQEAVKAKMERIRNEVANDKDFGRKDAEKLKLQEHKRLGWALRLPKGSAKVVRTKKGKKKKYEILLELTACIWFLPVGSDLSLRAKEHSAYQKQFNLRQNIIVDKTLAIAKTYIPVIHNVIRLFSEMDVLLSLSAVADNAQTAYIMPTVLPNSKNKVLRMKRARHPCLELIQMDEAGDVIPNDVEMVNGESSFQIVTGPNMGGKSTYIRMVGLITLMAQIGSYVPCDECTVTMVDSILARVGAGDNQMKGVSTFMAEMLEASSILEGATENSLVIIDELGRGTSTYDGFGIAFAMSEHIIDRLGSFCLFATHFHELSALEDKHKSAVNKHVDVFFDTEQDSLVMLYQIKDGPCPQSYGIQVAKLAKFPQKVIEIAKEKARQLESVEPASVEPVSATGIAPKLSADAISAMKKVLEYSRSHSGDADYKEKLQSLIEAEVKVSDAFNDLCTLVQEKHEKLSGNGAEKMEIDA